MALYSYSWKPSKGVLKYVNKFKQCWIMASLDAVKVNGWQQLCLCLRNLSSYEYVLTTGNSTSVPQKTPTPYLFLMKSKISLLGQQYSQCLIFIVDTGSCLSILQTETRLLSVQVLVWGFMSSAECHLGYQAPLFIPALNG